MRVNRSTVFCQITEKHLPSQTMIGSTFNACWFANRLTLERLHACRLVALRPRRTVQSFLRWACRLELVPSAFCSSLGAWTFSSPFRLRACAYPFLTAHSSWICMTVGCLALCLVFGIFYVWNLPVPAASTAAALSALLRSGTSPAPIFHRWRPRPESNRGLINHMWRHPDN